MTVKRRNFTTAQKREIVAFGDETSVKEALEKYSISESQFYRWKGSSAESSVPKKVAWSIESDDDYLIIKVPKKAATKELLSALL